MMPLRRLLLLGTAIAIAVPAPASELSAPICKEQHEMLTIDRSARTVAVRDLRTDALLQLPYDKLILARGN